MATKKTADTNTDLTKTYTQIEGDLLGHLTTVQVKLGKALKDNKFADARALSAIHKELMANYNEAVRLRKVNSVEEGRFIPAEVLAAYQEEVFPSIATAIDNLRISVLNSISSDVRPAVEKAWTASYPTMVLALQEAGKKLDEKVAAVRAQASEEQRTVTTKRGLLHEAKKPVQKKDGGRGAGRPRKK